MESPSYIAHTSRTPLLYATAASAANLSGVGVSSVARAILKTKTAELGLTQTVEGQKLIRLQVRQVVDELGNGANGLGAIVQLRNEPACE